MPRCVDEQPCAFIMYTDYIERNIDDDVVIRPDVCVVF